MDVVNGVIVIVSEGFARTRIFSLCLINCGVFFVCVLEVSWVRNNLGVKSCGIPSCVVLDR